MAKRSREGKVASAATKSKGADDGSDARRALQRAKDRMKQVQRSRKALDLNIDKLDEAIELIHVPHIGPPAPPPQPAKPKPPKTPKPQPPQK